jgi:uncharacterized protein (TIGR02996 family)
MSEEKAFLQAIADRPYDASLRLVYADWLEERGDPRAQAIRAKCQYRQPITPQEIRHLAAIAAARQQADADQVLVLADPTNPGYRLADGPIGNTALFEDSLADGPTCGGNLAEDLRHLSRLEIARNFPRDDAGRLQLDRTVLLAGYRCAEELPRGRELWLAAVGPARRSDPQVITVRLDLLIGDNQPHNWLQTRWWWDQRYQALDEQARWGITGAALRSVTGPNRGRKVAELETRWQAGTLTSAERITLCTALQDDGRFEDALRVCEVEYPEQLSRMLDAEPFRLSGGCCEPGTVKSATARAKKLRRALWEAAPWRFRRALADARAQLDAWRKSRSGRPRKIPQLRFFILPGSSHHARKPGLMLVPGAGGQPRLSFVFTASNVVLPETVWTRPVELDIARWCRPPGARGEGPQAWTIHWGGPAPSA